MGNASALTRADRHSNLINAQNVRMALNEITNVAHARFSREDCPPDRNQAEDVYMEPIESMAVPTSTFTVDTAAPASPRAPLPLPSVNPPELAPMMLDFEGPIGRNVQEVNEYVPEIVNQLFREEASFLPRPNYMDQQVDINAKMRAILIDWLIEVHMKYRLRPETLHLTVNIIDRYLSRVQVLRRNLQLLGVVAMFIASKFEEIDPPRLSDFVYITDSTYTREDILHMECNVLTLLSFRIVVPTVAHFFDRMQQANSCDAVQRELACYILELALVEIRMIRHCPSHLVAAALMLTNELLGRAVPWPPTMVLTSRYTAAALRACADESLAILQAAPAASLQAARKKYAQTSHSSVARMDFNVSV